MTMLFNFMNSYFSWLMIFVIVINFSQRKYPDSNRKRNATLYIAGDCLLLYLLVLLARQFGLPGFVDLISLAVCIALALILRKRFFPFRTRCRECGAKLDWEHIIGHDDNLCPECWKKANPEKARAEEERKKTREQSAEEGFTKADKVDQIDWDYWEPTERCVLAYITDGPRILLIEKKRGLGKGYINAPGGHIEPDETSWEAAVRETKEETGLDVSGLEQRAILRFQFKDGMRMIGYVFFSSDYSGTMIDECEETRPFWTDIETLDYSRMWEDDRLWLPPALEGKKLEGYFIFDDLKMVDYRIDLEEE